MTTDGERAFRSVLAIVDRYRTANDQEFPSGARLVCQLPWIHQNAWLHRVMPPCPEDGIATLAPFVIPRPKRWSPAWWWALEERIGLPSHTLPFGWLRRLETRLLEKLVAWLERK